jgi:hypothetical protein
MRLVITYTQDLPSPNFKADVPFLDRDDVVFRCAEGERIQPQ